MYILFKDGTVISRDYATEILDLFDCEIETNGQVKFMGFIDSISYNMKLFSKASALADFAVNRMPELLRRKGIHLFEGENA